jgi:hypothetical protein
VVELNLEIVSIVIACASITVGVISVIVKNRRDVKTREAQLFMQHRAGSTEEGAKSWSDVMYRQDWTTWDEYMEKYSLAVNPDASAKVLNLAVSYNTLGFLAREGLIGVNLIYRFNGPNIINAWERLEPYVRGIRPIYHPTFCDSFEWLYKQFKKIQEN